MVSITLQTLNSQEGTPFLIEWEAGVDDWEKRKTSFSCWVLKS
jgi:hypothetical protein